MTEKKGAIGRDFFVSSEEGKYLVVVEPDEVVVIEDKESDVIRVAIMGSIFRHTLKSGQKIDDHILNDDVSIQLQLPREVFNKEVQLVVESDRSVQYEFTDRKLAKAEEITKYVPRVKIKEGEDEI